MEPDTTPKRKPGRPPGSRNKVKLGDVERDRVMPPSKHALEDFTYADPSTLVARQLTLIDWMQQALRVEMRAGMAKKGEWVLQENVKKLVEISNALSRTIEALKRTTDLAEEMAKRMTPADLLEMALKKIEGQDIATLQYAIKRLRAYREKLTPTILGRERVNMGDTKATDLLAALEAE